MRMLGIAIPVVAALLLSGCLPTDPVVTPVPEASFTPVFASEDDALAAAEAAYAAYLKVSDEITASGGSNPERIKPFVTAQQYQVELDGFAYFASHGIKTIGASAFEIIELQQYSDRGDGTAEIGMYVCSDSSNVKLLDATGADVTPPGKVDRQTLEVHFQTTKAARTDLVLDGTGIWASNPDC